MSRHPAGLDNRLRARRQAAGFTQAALAARIGVSRKTVNTIENGVAVPSTLLALRLAAALSCRVEDIFALAPGGSSDELGSA